MYKTFQIIGIQFTHEIGRNPVVRVCQPPLHSHHVTNQLFVGITRRPRFSVFINQRVFHVAHFVAGRKTVLHSQCIKERLDGRTYLAASHHGHIVLEVMVVRSAYVCLDMSAARVHGHETGTKEELVVTDGIHRGHNGVFLPFPTEYGHLLRGVEGFLYFSFGGSGFLHEAVAVGQPHGTSQNLVHLLLGQTEGVGSFLGPFLFLEEVTLQFLQMLCHGILGILLHTRVERGIDFQPVGVEVVFGTVFLGVLFAPSKERVVLPVE